MGQPTFLFLNGCYINTLEELKYLLSDIRVNNKTCFQNEVLATMRDGILPNWLKEHKSNIVFNTEKSDSILYSDIIQKLTGKDFKAKKSNFLKECSEIARIEIDNEPLTFDSQDIKQCISLKNKKKATLKIIFNSLKPTNEKYKIRLLNVKNKDLIKEELIDWSNKTRNVEQKIEFNIETNHEYDLIVDNDTILSFKTLSYLDTLNLNLFGNQIKMILVKKGSFMMGSNYPVHFTYDYYFAEVLVTDTFYYSVMGGKKKSELPHEFSSIAYIQQFLDTLNSSCKQEYGVFDLPTEAEWEYAAKGGHKSNGAAFIYPGSNSYKEVAWSNFTSDYERHYVKQLKPNELGIYDLGGNLSEICLDTYVKDFYPDFENPLHFSKDKVNRVKRGGDYSSSYYYCRTEARNFASYEFHYDDHIGLRLCLRPKNIYANFKGN